VSWRVRTIEGGKILYLFIYVCYSYIVENGKTLLKESAITNLVEHPIQLRPPSMSLFGLFSVRNLPSACFQVPALCCTVPC
jgi:hypothetical protein